MVFNFNDIRKILPHKYPFLLVDQVLCMEKDKAAVGIKNIVYGDPYIEYDLEGNQFYPFELMIESLGQLTAILYSFSNNNKYEFVLGSIKGIHILKKVQVNSQIQMKVKIDHISDTYAIASGTVLDEDGVVILVADELICKINLIK